VLYNWSACYVRTNLKLSLSFTSYEFSVNFQLARFFCSLRFIRMKALYIAINIKTSIKCEKYDQGGGNFRFWRLWSLHVFSSIQKFSLIMLLSCTGTLCNLSKWRLKKVSQKNKIKLFSHFRPRQLQFIFFFVAIKNKRYKH